MFFNGKQKNDEEFGFIGIAITAGVSLLGSLLNKTGSGEARGLAGITAFGNETIQRLESLKEDVSRGQVKASDAKKEADGLVNALSNPATVYQAKKGADAAALQQFKSQAAALASEIKQIAPQVEQQMMQQQQQQQNQSSFGGNNTLIYAGLGVAAIYFLKDKK